MDSHHQQKPQHDVTPLQVQTDVVPEINKQVHYCRFHMKAVQLNPYPTSTATIKQRGA